MKSKVVKTLGLVLALTTCIGMTVFATPSPSASTVVTGATTDNPDVEIIIGELDEEGQKAAELLKTEEGLRAVFGDDFDENLIILDIVDVSVCSINGGKVEFPIDITFTVKGVTSSTKGWILHWNGSAWEKIPTKMGEGTMTGTFNSLSPVTFVVDKTTLSSGTASSPQTSASVAAGVAVAGLVAAAGALGLKKKEY